MIGWSSPLEYIDRNNENCASVVRLLQGGEGNTVES
jgi:hypothetical protein